jgi:hypothetical protein
MICENSPPPSVCTPASKKYVVSGLINQLAPIAPELSPAGRSTYDVFGNAAFAAANDPYGDVITELRPAPHATNGATGSPPTTGALVVVVGAAVVVVGAVGVVGAAGALGAVGVVVRGGAHAASTAADTVNPTSAHHDARREERCPRIRMAVYRQVAARS